MKLNVHNFDMNSLCFYLHYITTIKKVNRPLRSPLYNQTNPTQIRKKNSLFQLSSRYNNKKSIIIIFAHGVLRFDSKFLMLSSFLLFAMNTIYIIQIIYKLNLTSFAFRGLWWGFYCRRRGQESRI